MRRICEDGIERMRIRSFFMQSIYRINVGRIHEIVEKRRKMRQIALKQVSKLWKLLKEYVIMEQIDTGRKMCI